MTVTKAMMGGREITPEQAAAEIAKSDIDEDGKISLTEFIAQMKEEAESRG